MAISLFGFVDCFNLRNKKTLRNRLHMLYILHFVAYFVNKAMSKQTEKSHIICVFCLF